ncbi:hypothetical protein VKT23_015135 [Stygiomarasmius scandens]
MLRDCSDLDNQPTTVTNYQVASFEDAFGRDVTVTNQTFSSHSPQSSSGNAAVCNSNNACSAPMLTQTFDITSPFHLVDLVSGISDKQSTITFSNFPKDTAPSNEWSDVFFFEEQRTQTYLPSNLSGHSGSREQTLI